MNPGQQSRQPDEHKLVDLFWETIPPVWSRVREHIRMTVRENSDITIEQFHVLRLVNRGVESISGLAQAKRTSRSAMSQAVDGLVVRGLLSRTHDAQDRRYVRLALTDEGMQILHAIFEVNRCWLMKKMDALGREEVETIMAGLEKLKSAFEKEQENTSHAGG